MQKANKKRMITGITPSGEMTLGNYLGVAKRLLDYQNDYELLVFIANLHAITTPQDARQLKERTKKIATLLLATGLDPKKITIFRQSDVPAHSQLGWIMNTQLGMGELSRMTQYKEKSSKQQQIPSGLFTYPALMAADILLYDADLVPVGVDQKQHVELTRNLAQRLNQRLKSPLFRIPEPLLDQNQFRVRDLQNPTQKMSKSSLNPKAIVYLLDSPLSIEKKIKNALTDSENLILFDLQKKPGVSNLMMIYSLLSNESIKELEKKWDQKNYGELKSDVADAIVKELKPIQERYSQLLNSNLVEKTLEQGAQKMKKMATKKIKLIYQALGLE